MWYANKVNTGEDTMATHNYMFAHELIKVINSNKDFFLNTIAPNPKNMEYFISTDAPRIIFKEYNMPEMVVPVKSITGDIKQSTDKILLFIQFGEDFVNELLDSYALALSIADNGNVRLFTFEKGASMTGAEMGFVCEYRYDGSHVNYGGMANVNMMDFFNRVVEVLKEDSGEQTVEE